MQNKFYLSESWALKPVRPSTLPEEFIWPIEGVAARIPGTVHTDLVNHNLIPDPFFADNEKRLQWIGACDWFYETMFDLPEHKPSSHTTYLVFEGLDTLAEIELNGESLARTDNMFRQYRFNVSEKLNPQQNHLRVIFRSPVRYGQEKLETNPLPPSPLNSERVYLRKAQYAFGWDWGPAFATMGIWRPVYLWQSPPAWIETVRFHTESIQHNSAQCRIEIELGGDPSAAKQIDLELTGSQSSHRWTRKTNASSCYNMNVEISDPELWWPAGMGKSNLYTLTVHLTGTENESMDAASHEVGVRTIELITRDGDDTIFRFTVNDKPVYIKGANWIPVDSFLPRIRDEHYERLLTLAKDAGLNMIRVWGGGIYEQAAFYKWCDHLGLMVWQDFMFACGFYPEDESFLENVRNEVIENISRLQVHPSLALWCGNNENEWLWFNSNQGPLSAMPGHQIFHKLMPKIVEKLDPMRVYRPSSPFGEGADPNAPDSGNRHEWGIWSNWQDYDAVHSDNSLFVTEFGFQAPADINTMNACIPKDSRWPQSTMMEFHNKQTEGNARLFRFLSAHLPVATQWEDFIYLTQLNQALALQTCLEHWRFNTPNNAGSIIWQWNDCWPVASWSLIDTQIRPKIAYTFVKNLFADITLFIRRIDAQLSVHVSNPYNCEFNGRLFVDRYIPGKNLIHYSCPQSVSCKARDEIDVFKSEWHPLFNGEYCVAIFTLRSQEGDLISRYCLPSVEWKYLTMPAPKLEYNFEHQKRLLRVHNSGSVPAFFVDMVHPFISIKDRGFTLLPDESHTLMYETGDMTPEESEISMYMLNKYLEIDNKV